MPETCWDWFNSRNIHLIIVSSVGSVIHLLTYLLKSMEPISSWEANMFSPTQAISRILWNPQGSSPQSHLPTTCHYLSQLDPVHTYTSHLIHLNIIFPSTPVSPRWSLSFRFPHQNPVYASPLPPYVLHAPPVSFYSIFITQKTLGEQYRSLNSSLWR
jgi:hypothetical protein